MSIGSQRGQVCFRLQVLARALIPALVAFMQPYPCFSDDEDFDLPKVYFGVLGSPEALATEVCEEDLKGLSGLPDDGIQKCQRGIMNLVKQLFAGLKEQFQAREPGYVVLLDNPESPPRASWSPDDAEEINAKKDSPTEINYTHYILAKFDKKTEGLLPGDIPLVLTIEWEVGKFEKQGNERKLVYYSQAGDQDEKGVFTPYLTYIGPKRKSATQYAPVVFRKAGLTAPWSIGDPGDALNDIFGRILFFLPELADKYELHVQCPKVDSVEAILGRITPIDILPIDISINILSELAEELTNLGSDRAWTLDYFEKVTTPVSRDSYIQLFKKICEKLPDFHFDTAEDISKSVRFQIDECIGMCSGDPSSPKADKLPIVVHVFDGAMYQSLRMARLHHDLHQEPKVNKLVRHRMELSVIDRSTNWYVKNVCVDRASLTNRSHDLAQFLALNVRKSLGEPALLISSSDWTCGSSPVGP